MDILLQKEPSYVRCIKPNDKKQSGVFNEEIVKHQVKYLGLMENLRVKRAGFAYRREYSQFLKRLVYIFQIFCILFLCQQSKSRWPRQGID